MSADGTKTRDVITVGDVFVDLVMSGFPKWPEPGEEVIAGSLRREAGGGAAITACGLAALGCRVALLGAIGPAGEADGEWFAGRVASCGVDIGLLQRNAEHPTAVTVAVSTAEDRSFFTYPGANAAIPAMLREATTHRLLATARHVHLAHGVDPGTLIGLASSLHAAGSTISVDAGWIEPWLRDPQTLAALRSVDIFLPNQREGEAMTGEHEPRRILARFAEAGLATVALKLGSAGSLLLHDGRLHEAPPFPVTAIETTGAGDCFDAGTIAALLAGLPPNEWIASGNRCGALSTLHPGGIEGVRRGLKSWNSSSHRSENSL